MGIAATTRQSQTAIGYLRWLIVIVPFLMWFFGTGEKLNVGVVIANRPFLQEMNLVGHNATLGSLTSWFLIGYGVSALPWGFVIDRIGTRNTALLATLIGFIAMIWFGMATSTLQLQTSRLLLGISEGVLHPFSNALIARWFPFKERGRATGIWWCATGFGSALLTPVFASLIISLGWREAFVSYGIMVTVVLLPLIIAFVCDNPAQKKWMSASELDYIAAGHHLPDSVQRQIDATNTATTSGILRNKVFWMNSLCNLANSQIHWGTLTWGITFLVAFRHISLLNSGLFVGAGFALSILITLGIGYGSDLVGRRAPFGIALYALIFVTLLGSLLAPWPYVSAAALAIAIGATQSGGAVYVTMLHSFMPAGSIARGTGMQAFAINILASVSPVFIGALIGTHGNWTAGFIFLLIWPVISIWTMILCTRWGL